MNQRTELISSFPIIIRFISKRVVISERRPRNRNEKERRAIYRSTNHRARRYRILFLEEKDRRSGFYVRLRTGLWDDAVKVKPNLGYAPTAMAWSRG